METTTEDIKPPRTEKKHDAFKVLKRIEAVPGAKEKELTSRPIDPASPKCSVNSIDTSRPVYIVITQRDNSDLESYAKRVFQKYSAETWRHIMIDKFYDDRYYEQDFAEEYLFVEGEKDPTDPKEELYVNCHVVRRYWNNLYDETMWSGRTGYQHDLEDEFKLKCALELSEETGFPVIVIHDGDGEGNIKQKRIGERRYFTGTEKSVLKWLDLRAPAAELIRLSGSPPDPRKTLAKNIFPRRDEMADRYWETKTFRLFCGRHYKLVPPCHVVTYLCIMALHGQKKAFVKDARCKRGTWSIDLGGVIGEDGFPDEKAAYDAIPRSMLSAMLETGIPRSALFKSVPENTGMLIQDHLTMLHEYRIFIVDGRPVAGAAVQRQTDVSQIYRRGRFNPVVVDDRNQTGAGHINRSLVARYARFAREFAAYAKDEGVLLDYVLDVCLTDGGEVVAIEVNSLEQTGLYAADYSRVSKRIKAILPELTEHADNPLRAEIEVQEKIGNEEVPVMR